MKKKIVAAVVVGAITGALLVTVIGWRYQYHEGVIFDRWTGNTRYMNRTIPKDVGNNADTENVDKANVDKAIEILSGK